MLQQLDHIAIAVADPQKSAAWYHEVLGLERRHQEVWGDHPIMMAAGDTMLALFPATTGAAVSPPQTGTGLRHFAFRAGWEYFNHAKTELARRGITFNEQDHQISRSIYFHDLDGFQIEITTYELPAAGGG